MLPVINIETLFADFRLSPSNRFGDVSENTLLLKRSDSFENRRDRTTYIAGDLWWG